MKRLALALALLALPVAAQAANAELTETEIEDRQELCHLTRAHSAMMCMMMWNTERIALVYAKTAMKECQIYEHKWKDDNPWARNCPVWRAYIKERWKL